MKSQATEWGWSKYETYLQCPKKYWFKYEEHKAGLGDVANSGTPATNLGSYVHLLSQKKLKPRSVTGKMMIEAERDLSEYDRHLAPSLVEKWAKLKLSIKKVIQVEKVMMNKLGDVPYSCRHDAIIKMDNGLWAWDFKTCGYMSDNYVQSWMTSGTVIGQYILAKQKYSELCGVVVIVIPKARGYRLAIPIFCVPSMAQIDWFEDLIHNIYVGISAQMFPRAFKCLTQYGLCEYQHRCL